jgi:DNA-binding NarL/FixJ family response regulator
MHSEEDMFNEALDLGALGYVLKESAISDIVAAVKMVARGQHYLSPAISGFLVRRGQRAASLQREKPGLSSLTQSEIRILKLIAEDKTSKEIAETLFISHRTVENHRTNICQKLGLTGTHALLRFALKHKSELS